MTAADRKRQGEIVAHWRESAQSDWVIAEDNLKLGHYHWALFLCHLAIEKQLKALVVRAELTPPLTHDLAQLWKLANLDLSVPFAAWLEEIAQYNIAGRYDDEKRAFYHKATKAYTETWFSRCREVFTWLDQQLTD